MYKLSSKKYRFITVADVFVKNMFDNKQTKTRVKSGTIELIYPSIIGWQHCLQTDKLLGFRKKTRIMLSHTHTHILLQTHAYQSKPREQKINRTVFSCIAIESTIDKMLIYNYMRF